MPSWPVRARVQTNESLTSWFMRTALALAIDPHTLRALVFNQQRYVLFDFDISFSKDDLLKLSSLSGIPFDSLRSADLHNREGCSFTEYSRNKRVWLTNQYGGKPKRRIASICPMCLATDPVKFLRRDWRFTFTTVCQSHRTRLIDSCPGCESQFSTDSQSLYNTSIAGCMKCGMDFMDMSTPCEEVMLPNNKFLDDITGTKLSKWRAYRKLERIIVNLFGPGAHRWRSQILPRLARFTPKEEYDGLLEALPYKITSNRLCELNSEYRHSILKIAFTMYNHSLDRIYHNQH